MDKPNENMKFLIDNSIKIVNKRLIQYPDGVLGQLLTPLTRYRKGNFPTGIDNGCFSGLKINEFKSLLTREYVDRENILFVVVPDCVGSHIKTLEMFKIYNNLCDGFKKAFVAQDGFDILPNDIDSIVSSIFIGGTTNFKESEEVLNIINYYKSNKHIHIGRVNSRYTSSM